MEILAVVISFIVGVVMGASVFIFVVAADRYDYVSAESIEDYGSTNPAEAGVIAEMLETIGYDDVAERVRDNAARVK